MPRSRRSCPLSLERQCQLAYLRYLHDEMTLLAQMKTFEDRSVLLKHYGIRSEALVRILDRQLSFSLKGILHDIVRQRMVDMLIADMHAVVALESLETISTSAAPTPGGAQAPAAVAAAAAAELELDAHPAISGSAASPASTTLNFLVRRASPSRCLLSANSHCRMLPVVQLFELVLHKELKCLDFGQNKKWKDSDRLPEVARVIWKIVGEKCSMLEKFVMPKELSYSSTLNSVIRNNQFLTHLTLKRNVPNNMFLSLVGSSCPNLVELDIAGAEVVTDFGVVCLLFQDPEQIFIECWNREKTVGSVRRSQRAFPHPHFDKPIPDPTENPICNRNSTQFLHLKKSFHDVVRDSSYEWETLPISRSLKKIRLENTKVKGDGASVILETCPNLVSLGYLVFAAAGLKQVFGYEKRHKTNFTEIFYRGPSDQKLLTIANCCPKLSNMFLGSNSIRRITVGLFAHWTALEYLTLENIFVDDVLSCLQLIGKQLKGLKLQCSGFDVSDVAASCPNLATLVIQKEVPISTLRTAPMTTTTRMFSCLRQLEITSSSFPKTCFNFIMRNAINLRSVKVYQVPGLRREDIESWSGVQSKLETLLIFRAPEINLEAVEHLLDSLPSLRVLGDFSSFDVKRPVEIRRVLGRIKDERWDCSIVDSDTSNGGGVEDKDFCRLLSLHWFYLTETPEKVDSC